MYKSKLFIALHSVAKEPGRLNRFTNESLHCFVTNKNVAIEMTPKENIDRPVTIGQPTPLSHPHLLKADEITEGMKIIDYQTRRNRLVDIILYEMEKIYKERKYFVAVIPSASKIFMSEKIPYPFRQNSDFFYLTGCLESDAALIISGTNEENSITTLFLRSRNFDTEMWDGPQTGVEGAPIHFGINQVAYLYTVNDFLNQVAKSFPDHILMYDFNSVNPPQSFIHETMKQYVQKLQPEGKLKVNDQLRSYVHKLRLIKSNTERNLMIKSCAIAAAAVTKTIADTRPGMTEHQLWAKVDYECRQAGAEMLAYPPVVAAGTNALTIHYIRNKQRIRDEDLILMDAGCEYWGYCSDITRTWPANGKFSDNQRVLYEVLLDVQKSLIKACDEHVSLDVIYQKMIFALGEKLTQAKVIKHGGVLGPALQNRITAELCPHHVGHYLGMDVHDTATVARNIALQEGMVVTIEPGIYVKENNTAVASEFVGLGMRIEDDVLITNCTSQVLTEKCPKEIVEIESLFRSSSHINL